MKAKRFKRIICWFLLMPLALVAIALLVIYAKQDAIVQSQIDSLNESFEGEIAVGDVHLAPFESFPYISLKVDDVLIKESKAEDAKSSKG